MVAIGDHVDRDTNATRDDQLGLCGVNSLNQPSTKLAGILQIEGSEAGRGPALVERIDGLDKDSPAVGQQQKLAYGFAGRKKKTAFVKINLDLEFGLELCNDPRRRGNRHGASTR